MFTGIIETLGKVESVHQHGSNLSFLIKSGITSELKVDQSISHNGVCLTIEEINGDHYKVTAVPETLSKTNLGNWQPGTLVNLERSMLLNGRFDGHIVQGHTDTTATCQEIKSLNGSHEFRFSLKHPHNGLLIEKGSVSVNGISLTCFSVTANAFSVAIIPYTYRHTNISQLSTSDSVNIEFDVIGKYVAGMAERRSEQNE